MSQTRGASLAEAVANVLVGFAVSVILTFIILPVFGATVTVIQAGGISLVYTTATLMRSYALRRLFNRINHAPAGE
jgi:hypothetical protein